MSKETRVALVTGASRAEGIGVELCRQLASRGFEVILTARKLADARDRAAELLQAGIAGHPTEVDVTRDESVGALAAEVEDRFGRLDILVNNAAGVARYGELATSTDLETAHAVLETTLYGSWRMIQAFLPLLRRSSHARIVNVSSGAGSHGDAAFGLNTDNGMGTSYAVAKAALNALTVKVSRELRDDRVLVNAVCPGFTATFAGGEAMGARPVAEGAASILWAALLPDDGPTGGFFRDGKPLPW